MASEKILNQKKEEVSKLAAKIKEAKVVLLTDYRGINVSDVTDLRTKLRGAEVEYKVIKQKEEEVNSLADKIKDAKLVLLAEYRGINVEDVTNLRATLRKSNSEYKICKNNITRRALAECEIEGLDEVLEGPTAVIMGNNDYLEACKIVYEYAKDNDFYKIKGGIIDGKVVPVEEIITLAKLPSRETLIAMLAGGLLGTISKLAVALDQVRLQKENA